MSSLISIKSTSSWVNSLAIDPNQLLTTCQKIKDNISKLDKCIRLAQLRMATLVYVNENADDYSLKCSDDLIEVCNLSQLLVQQFDELHLKLIESAENSISYQIASQQLAFFTSEWYDDLTPKFNQTLEMADKLQLNFLDSPKTTTTPTTTPKATEVTGAEARVRDALLRLRQSMNENERLIATIATNIEYTKATIEAIYDSLQSTKLNLEAGEQNIIEAIHVVHQTNWLSLTLYIIGGTLAVLIMYFIARLLGIV